MNIALRIMALLIIVPATYYFVYWLPLSFISFGEQRWVANVVSGILAICAGWYVWVNTNTKKKELIPSIIYGAFVIGGIGFVGGFFGPIIFTQSSNQGPLLGLFITGPIGFLIGGVGGFIHWLMHGNKLTLDE